jgi:hypothetical protein
VAVGWAVSVPATIARLMALIVASTFAVGSGVGAGPQAASSAVINSKGSNIRFIILLSVFFVCLAMISA